MDEREYKVIRQRCAVNLDNFEDTRALCDEVGRLRQVLADVRDMTGDPAIIRTINNALGE